MTSEQIRDPLTDNLLTPANCALVIIDYQPTQVNSIRSMDRGSWPTRPGPPIVSSSLSPMLGRAHQLISGRTNYRG
jgi:nicotinamidase-related amidase